MEYTTTSSTRARNAPNPACAVCCARATSWLRATAECGLVVAAYSCAEHEAQVERALRSTTIEQYAASIPPSQRARRAAAARRKADRLADIGRAHMRASADARGASSATHTHALMAGHHERRAQALYALSAALLQ